MSIEWSVLTTTLGIIAGWAGSWLKTRVDLKRVNAETAVAQARLQPELAALALETVEKANAALRADNEILRGERDYYRERLNAALQELDQVSEDLRKAQAITAKLQAQISALLAQDGLAGKGDEND